MEEYKGVKDFIIFSHIKEFVEDLCSVHKDEPLRAYLTFMEDANVLTDLSEFVVNFKECLDGKKKATLCSGVYINVPKFLAKNDETSETILKYLDFFKKLYENPEGVCPEAKFMKEKGIRIMGEVQESVNPNSQLEPTQDHLQRLVEVIKPALMDSRQQFYQKDLNSDRFVKIMVVGIYEKLKEKNIFGDDIQHVKNIIDIVANTSLSELTKRKVDIMKEALSIRDIQKIPLKELGF